MICPFTTFEHGADRDIPLSNIRVVTLHRTGNFGWVGNRIVGLQRMHGPTGGTFHFLIGREDGQASQFYPANCYCSHAAGANQSGPGVEFEGPPGEPLTAWQLSKGGEVIRWLSAELWIPLTYYDGYRIQIDGGAYAGFVSHRAIQSSLPHSDYVEAAEFDQMAKGDDFLSALTDDQQKYIYYTLAKLMTGVESEPNGPGIYPGGPIDEGWKAAKKILSGSPSGGGLTEAQVRTIFQEELAKLKLTAS